MIDPHGDHHDNRYEDGEEYVDPFEFHFMPGYPTEMDYLNSLEADDYLHEGEDIEF